MFLRWMQKWKWQKEQFVYINNGNNNNKVVQRRKKLFKKKFKFILETKPIFLRQIASKVRPVKVILSTTRWYQYWCRQTLSSSRKTNCSTPNWSVSTVTCLFFFFQKPTTVFLFLFNMLDVEYILFIILTNQTHL